MSYQAEAAKSNRAQCRETSCKQRIGIGELRIGHQGSDWYSWYHASCAWKTFDNRYIKNPRITSENDISNFDTLSQEHRNIIRSLIEGTYVEPKVERVSRPRRGANAAVDEQAEETEQAVSSRKRKAGDEV